MGPQETEKLFFKAKDTVNRTNQYSTNWERIFTNPTSVRGLILKISKELKNLDTDNSNNPATKQHKTKNPSKNKTKQNKPN